MDETDMNWTGITTTTTIVAAVAAIIMSDSRGEMRQK